MRRAIATLCSIALLFTQTGCVFTRPMWDQAKATQLRGPVLLVQGRGDAVPRFQAIYFVNGRSSDAYLYDLPAPAAVVLAASVATSQPASTRPVAQPTWDTMLAARHLRYAAVGVNLGPGTFVRTVSTTELRTLADAAMARPLHADADGRSYDSCVAVFAIDERGRLFFDPSPERPPVAVPGTRTARVVALPSEVPRPTGPRNGAIFVATLLTPFTVVADIIATPVVVVWMLTYGPKC